MNSPENPTTTTSATTPTIPISPNPRLNRQLQFLIEADQLKSVERQTHLCDASRRENAAEHSWHFALALLLFLETAREQNLNVERLLKMAILHDLVEIDAGDTFVYDAQAQQSRAAREEAAADRIFGILPDDLAQEFRAIWEEFEAKQTPEARFASAVDRFCPVLQNFASQGLAWRKHGVSVAQVEKVVGSELEEAPELAAYLRILLGQAGEKGFLKR